MKKINKILAMFVFLCLVTFGINATSSNNSALVDGANKTELKAGGNCIYANYRIGGVCSGATERLCEGPPECSHPPKQIR